MFLSFERNIVFIVFGRFTVSVCIDTEYRKVASMTGPHPVIGFPTEFTDR